MGRAKGQKSVASSALASTRKAKPVVEGLPARRADGYGQMLQSTRYKDELENALVTVDWYDNDWLTASSSPLTHLPNFRAVFHDFVHQPSGLRAVVHETKPSSWDNPAEKQQANPYLNYGNQGAQISIYNREGDFVGHAGIFIKRDEFGDLFGNIGDFSLRPGPEPENNFKKDFTPEQQEANMGTGFGRAFLEHVEKQLKAGGVKYMRLHAVGHSSRAWAAMGYELDPRTLAKKGEVLTVARANEIVQQHLRNRLNYALESVGDYDEQTRKEIEHVSNNKVIDILDVASIGRSRQTKTNEGRSQWAGLDIIGTWDGIKLL